jgi:hypothetical protein
MYFFFYVFKDDFCWIEKEKKNILDVLYKIFYIILFENSCFIFLILFVKIKNYDKRDQKNFEFELNNLKFLKIIFFFFLQINIINNNIEKGFFSEKQNNLSLLKLYKSVSFFPFNLLFFFYFYNLKLQIFFFNKCLSLIKFKINQKFLNFNLSLLKRKKEKNNFFFSKIFFFKFTYRFFKTRYYFRNIRYL